MSRHSMINDEGHEICYGLDHAVGYFVQKFEKVDKDGLSVTVDLDYLNSNKGEIVEKMTELGVPQSVIDNVVVDLPI